MVARKAGVSLCSVAALAAALAAGASEPAADLWMCGLNPGDPPVKVASGAPRPVPEAEAVLWREGRPIVRIPAGVPLPVEIPEGRTLEIAVADPEGKPAAGVLLQWKPEGLPNLPEPMGRVRTDDAGRARIPVEPGKGTVVWVDEVGFLPVPSPLSPSTSRATLPLVPAPQRVLRVKDAYGRELAGARLKAFPAKDLADPVTLFQRHQEIVRELSGDETGRLVLPEGLTGAAGAVAAPGCSLEEVPSLDSLREVVLRPAAPVRVTVRDALTGKPLPHVKVTCAFGSPRLPLLAFQREEEWSSGTGTLRPGAYPCRVTATAQGRVPAAVKLEAPPARNEVEFSLEMGVVFAGTVSNAEGQPIAGALVGVAGYPDLRCRTDEKGSFQLPPLPRSGAPFTLEAGAEGYLDREIPGLPAKDRRSLRVVLDRGAAVMGRVVDEETRQPVPGARVTFQVQGSSSSQGFTFEARPDSDGLFRKEGLDPGTYVVRAYAQGLCAPPSTVTLTGAETQDLGDLLLSGHPAVRGLVALAGGEPPSARASVRLERLLDFKEVLTALNGRSWEGPVDRDGAFVLRGVPPGRYRLLASDGNRAKTLAPVTVESEDVDVGKVVLEPSSSLRGRLVGNDGGDLSSWRITLSTQAFDFDPATAVTDAHGAFVFEELPPGTYRLQAYPPMALAPAADQRVVLEAGVDREITVPVGGVTVTVFLQVDGRPAANADVAVSGPSDAVFDAGVVVLDSPYGKVLVGLPSLVRQGRSDVAGMATLEGLSPGPGQAVLYLGGMVYRMPVTVPSSSEVPLTWNFAGLKLEGRVLDGQGTAAPNVLVTLGYAGVGASPANTVLTDAEGFFRFTGLGEGRVLVGCRNPEGLTATATVVLSAGKPPEPVVLRLGTGG